jgi:hypothetical protein
MTNSPPYLFVYGSLMSDFSSFLRRFDTVSQQNMFAINGVNKFLEEPNAYASPDSSEAVKIYPRTVKQSQ